MTVLEILKTYLFEQNFDGLCNDNCGCELKDLAPCDQIKDDCKAAYKHIRPDCSHCENSCESKDIGEPCFKEDKPKE